MGQIAQMVEEAMECIKITDGAPAWLGRLSG